ncbi:MAG: hypothetical protein RIQ60_156 [Pseudomonadota bacterium]|jgi:membrane-bound lytic murein transglycosylase D
MTTAPAQPGRRHLRSLRPSLLHWAALTLVAQFTLGGCASPTRTADALETPPLLVEVPSAGPSAAAAAADGSLASSRRQTSVATLEELVSAINPARLLPASEAAAAAGSANTATGAVGAQGLGAAAGASQAASSGGTAASSSSAQGLAAVAPSRPARTASPLVSARLVERGEVTLPPPVNASVTASVPASVPPSLAALVPTSMPAPAPAAVSAAASALVPAPAAAPASAIAPGEGKAIGPLVAPPLPVASVQGASVAASAPTDTLDPDRQVSPDDPQTHTDLWERLREGYALAALDSPLVRDHERWYASRPEYVQRMMERGSRYLFHIVEEVNRRGMPSELALLPFIESAFNPQAKSVAAASGMWQFMPATGRTFELKQNYFRDDRRDVLASTRAALDYLAKLHGQFGDWQLALAAYNWGEGNVSRAIARNLRAGRSARYADLKMPAETRNYVPKLQAVKNIVNDAEKFGLTLPELRNHPYFLSVPIHRDIDVAVAARLALMDEDEFRSLNPSFDKPVILAAGTPQLLLPYDNADEFDRNLADWQGPLASWTAWRLPRTAKPAEAAKLAGIDEDTLRSVNHIPPRMSIKAGSVLLVPRDDEQLKDVPGHVADNAQMLLQPDGPLLRRVVYRAGRSDSVASLARRYRVAPAQLAQWNQMGADGQFASGQQVVIYVPSATTRVARAGTRGRHGVATAAANKGRASKQAAAKPAGRSAAAKSTHAAQRNGLKGATAAAR